MWLVGRHGCKPTHICMLTDASLRDGGMQVTGGMALASYGQDQWFLEFAWAVPTMHIDIGLGEAAGVVLQLELLGMWLEGRRYGGMG